MARMPWTRMALAISVGVASATFAQTPPLPRPSPVPHGPSELIPTNKVPSRHESDLHQAEPITPSGLPSTSPSSPTSPKNPLPSAIGLEGLGQLVVARSIGPLNGDTDPMIDRKARLAFDTAETHFRSCEVADADRWYREVIRLAPSSLLAALADERLNRSNKPAKPKHETNEPPLAVLSLDAAQLKVLWEAARQYRQAIESGDQVRIDRCSKSLDMILQLTESKP